MGGKRLKVNQFSQTFEESPMEGVANLADIMLVFICGLLVAIIMYWNVNLNDVSMIVSQDQMIIIDDAEQVENQMKAISQYGGLGTAYADPETGEIFVIKEEE